MTECVAALVTQPHLPFESLFVGFGVEERDGELAATRKLACSRFLLGSESRKPSALCESGSVTAQPILAHAVTGQRTGWLDQGDDCSGYGKAKQAPPRNLNQQVVPVSQRKAVRKVTKFVGSFRAMQPKFRSLYVLENGGQIG